jgi:poly(A) polymerase
VVEPRVIPRAEHTISRRDIDPDALKVLYRLRQGEHVAYLVGGSVRDLLLSRRPKDFDIGTSAHPYQVKKLFRNCWIIGRRFRLAHVKFGTKVIEVATFRRQLQPGEEIVQEGVPAPVQHAEAEGERTGRAPALPIAHHDNTFGTPEEDAFRRDFTINALFYDIATFSIIDYVSGMDDLRSGIVRSIGDPEVRFREDPVRMLRAIALAARLDFRVDPPILEAIRIHRHEIARSSAARLLEEYYKILRSGHAEKIFRGLAAAGLLEPISAELHRRADEPLWQSLAALDAYRARFEGVPDTFTNALLLGSLLVPLGFTPQSYTRENPRESPARDHPVKAGSHRGAAPLGHAAATHTNVEASDSSRTAAADSAGTGDRRKARPTGPRLGELPLARRDVERLSQVLTLQRRLREPGTNTRVQHALTHRSIFREALTWLDIHGAAPLLVDHWKSMLEQRGPADPAAPPGSDEPAPRRRRRRRRRRFRPTPT